MLAISINDDEVLCISICSFRKGSIECTAVPFVDLVLDDPAHDPSPAVAVDLDPRLRVGLLHRNDHLVPRSVAEGAEPEPVRGGVSVGIYEPPAQAGELVKGG